MAATFNDKIAPSGLTDYVFFVRATGNVAREAIDQANRYFAQGVDLNFVDIKSWAIEMLATIGQAGRARFNQQIVDLLEGPDVPMAVRQLWNESIAAITAI